MDAEQYARQKIAEAVAHQALVAKNAEVREWYTNLLEQIILSHADGDPHRRLMVETASEWYRGLLTLNEVADIFAEAGVDLAVFAGIDAAVFLADAMRSAKYGYERDFNTAQLLHWSLQPARV